MRKQMDFSKEFLKYLSKRKEGKSGKKKDERVIVNEIINELDHMISFLGS